MSHSAIPSVNELEEAAKALFAIFNDPNQLEAGTSGSVLNPSEAKNAFRDQTCQVNRTRETPVDEHAFSIHENQYQSASNVIQSLQPSPNIPSQMSPQQFGCQVLSTSLSDDSSSILRGVHSHPHHLTRSPYHHHTFQDPQTQLHPQQQQQHYPPLHNNSQGSYGSYTHANQGLPYGQHTSSFSQQPAAPMAYSDVPSPYFSQAPIPYHDPGFAEQQQQDAFRRAYEQGKRDAEERIKKDIRAKQEQAERDRARSLANRPTMEMLKKAAAEQALLSKQAEEDKLRSETEIKEALDVRLAEEDMYHSSLLKQSESLKKYGGGVMAKKSLVRSNAKDAVHAIHTVRAEDSELSVISGPSKQFKSKLNSCSIVLDDDGNAIEADVSLKDSANGDQVIVDLSKQSEERLESTTGSKLEGKSLSEVTVARAEFFADSGIDLKARPLSKATDGEIERQAHTLKVVSVPKVTRPAISKAFEKSLNVGHLSSSDIANSAKNSQRNSHIFNSLMSKHQQVQKRATKEYFNSLKPTDPEVLRSQRMQEEKEQRLKAVQLLRQHQQQAFPSGGSNSSVGFSVAAATATAAASSTSSRNASIGQKRSLELIPQHSHSQSPSLSPSQVQLQQLPSKHKRVALAAKVKRQHLPKATSASIYQSIIHSDDDEDE